MVTWFTMTLIAVCFLAIAELTQQHILTNKNPLSEKTSMGLTSFFVAILSLLSAAIMGKLNTLNSLSLNSNLPYLVTVSITSFLAIYLYLKSFNVRNISISIIFMGSSVLVTIPLGILLFGESMSIYKILGVTLTISASLIVNFAKKSIEKNNYYAIFAGILFGINYIIDKKLVLESHPTTYLGIILLVSSFLALSTDIKQIKTELNIIKSRVLIFIVTSAFLYFFYNVLIFYAYTYKGEVGKIDAINGIYIFIVIAVEFYLLKQKDHIKRKLIGGIFAITGVLLLGLYN